MIKFLMFVLGLAFTASVYGGTSVSDLREVSVQIRGNGGGGSGVIYRSYSHASFVLTNAHVCGIGKGGALYVHTNEGQKYIVDSYKMSNIHDVCVIKVLSDLQHNTKLASSEASVGETITISGHPFLFPTMVSEGYKK